MTGNYLAQIARHRETLTRGQRRVQQVEAVAVAVLRFADDEDGDDYEVFFCDLGDSTVLCLSGDAVTEASQDGEFPCLRFERLGYPDGGGFDALVSKSEPVAPACGYDWAELTGVRMPEDGEILTGTSRHAARCLHPRLGFDRHAAARQRDLVVHAGSVRHQR